MALDLTGISNENEYFTHFYMSTVFENDLKEISSKWDAIEEESGEAKLLDESPLKLIRGIGNKFKKLKQHVDWGFADDYLRVFFVEFFKYLGYPTKPILRELDGETALPLLLEVKKQNGAPQLWAIGVSAETGLEGDPLTEPFFPIRDDALVGNCKWSNELSLEDFITKKVFSLKEPPRFVIVCSEEQILLLDRAKWNERRILRFDLSEIYARKQEASLKTLTALLLRSELCPEEGRSLLDTLDEKSHEHAFSVSEDLKYTMREAIEEIGNEAIYYLKTVKKEKIYDTNLAPDLTRECLRYMYRLLFLFYIEARPELGYAPMKSESYRKGYSLESLRELELVELQSKEALDGYFLYDSIQMIFRLIYEGHDHKDADIKPTLDLDAGQKSFGFEVPPLKSHLFDPERTPILNRVRFRNSVLQKIIQLMSLNREKKGKKFRRGRISYAQLGINQLGAVYEGLLSYQGFFAETELYEVKRADDTHDELQPAYFVKKEDLKKYKADEIVEFDGKPKVHEKGRFIYRLSGREREKSASYYTPEVLTKCLVMYSLKEVLKDKKADEILNLTVCEPAMGSGAFLNEAINQLAQAYLDEKQKELGKWIPHDEFLQELQKVKMFIADRNCFGVDMNPIAVELAEVSLWLNTIHEGAFVPWFGMQLASGNSLIGARREVYVAAQLDGKQKNNMWFDHSPRRLKPGENRQEGQIYHFLLPDCGMANYKDKTVKKLAPDQIKKIESWRKDFVKPFSKAQVDTLLCLSESVDKLWEQHARIQSELRNKTTDQIQVWGHQEKFVDHITSTREKDSRYEQEMLSERVLSSGPYRRLKLAMDYWCALWFWPVDEFKLLPNRDEYLMELASILDTDVVATIEEGETLPLFPDSVGEETREKLKSLGIVDLRKLLSVSSRLRLAVGLTEKYPFMHWELEFADLFAERGGFDLVLGNPPWSRARIELKGILASFDPIVSVQGMDAASTKKFLSKIASLEGIGEIILSELCADLSSREFLSSGLYSLSADKNKNLYKSFFELSDRLGSADATIAILHDPGIYDEPEAGRLRRWLVETLLFQLRFVNQLNHFPEEALGHAGEFCMSICSHKKMDEFVSISNLFHPVTIEESLVPNGGQQTLPLIKDDAGWVVRGHPDRTIRYEKTHFLDSNGTGGTPPVFSYYAKSFVKLVERTLKADSFDSLIGDSKSSPIMDENDEKNNGNIVRSAETVEDANELILSGPHIYVGTPFDKQANEGCRSKGDYSTVQFSEVSESFLPRPVYNLTAEGSKREFYRSGANDKVIGEFRLAWRNWVSRFNERTLISAIIPPKVLHVNKIVSCPIPNWKNLCLMGGLSFSLPYDFLIRVKGIDGVWESDIRALPLPKMSKMLEEEIIEQTVKLVCLTKHYQEIFESVFKDKQRISGVYLRAEDRRLGLVSLDVLSAMALGMTLDELKMLYRIEFSTLFSNENSTYYDNEGKIVFTTNKGVKGGYVKRNVWSKIKDKTEGRYSQNGDPSSGTDSFLAPFSNRDRENDYDSLWRKFEERFKGKS